MFDIFFRSFLLPVPPLYTLHIRFTALHTQSNHRDLTLIPLFVCFFGFVASELVFGTYR